jgi:hypothetical protein
MARQSVVPHAVARQGRPHRRPRQPRSNVRVMVAPSVVPTHLAQQSGTVMPLALARPKGLRDENIFYP